LQGCDPREPSSTESPFFGCAEGQNCSIWFDYENGQCFEAALANQEGELCENEDQCGPGLTCGGNGGLACARWCAVGADDCQPEEECLPDFYYRYSGDQDGGPIYLSSAGVEFGHCAAQLAFETVAAETPLPDADPETGDFGILTSEVTLSGMSPELRVSMTRVTLNVTHDFLGDLSIKLVSPDGYEIILVNAYELEDASATSFENTVIDDTGTTPLTLGMAPYPGTFTPSEPLWTLLGTNPNGTWQLVIADEANGDTGTLHSWSLTLF
jgi:subtilisin-like proprotein convertase family protein